MGLNKAVVKVEICQPREDWLLVWLSIFLVGGFGRWAVTIIAVELVSVFNYLKVGDNLDFVLFELAAGRLVVSPVEVRLGRCPLSQQGCTAAPEEF